MLKVDGKTHAFLSTLSSFTIPVVLMFAVLLIGFGPPESDSAEIQGFAFTLMSFPVVFVFQLLAYWALGKAQYKRSRPSLKLGGLVGAVLAVPLTVAVLSIAVVTGSTYWEAVIGALLYMFIPLWLSFSMGAATQYYLMARHA